MPALSEGPAETPVIRRILVAIKDPYAPSLHVIDKAAEIARALDAQLEIFHAIEIPLNVESAFVHEGCDDVQHERDALHAQLSIVASRAQERGATVAVAAERDSPAHEAIIRRARAIDADLIVCASHAGRLRAPWPVTRTDLALVRQSPIPVLLVKTRRAYDRPVILAAVDPRRRFSKPHDLDDAILAVAQQVAEALPGVLHVTHAFTSQQASRGPSARWSGNTPERLAARNRLDALLRKVDVPRHRKHLVAQNTKGAIPDLAQKLHTGIVVVGSVGRSGISRLVIGNTAERLLGTLACDILVVKPSRFVSAVPEERRVRFTAIYVPVP